MKSEPPEPQNPTHDDLIKGLLSRPRLLAEFFHAFVPEVLEFADMGRIEYLDKEHPRAGRRPRRTGDMLVKTRWLDRDAAFLFHIESQGRHEPALLERAGEYAYRDSIRYRMPVMPVLLLTYPKPVQPQPEALTWTFGKAAELHLRCPVLHFRRMDPQPHLSSRNVASLALSSLMDLAPAQQVEAIVQTLAESLRQKLEADDVEAASAFVKHYSPLQPEQLLQLRERVRTLSQQDPALDPMTTLVNPFVELGKLEGRMEGRMEGRTQGELALTLRQLRRKFPALADQTRSKVEKLDEEKLLAFGEALLFFQSEADCLDWLRSA